MKKLIYLIVLIVVLGLIISGCIPVVPPTEQNEPGSLTNKASGDEWHVPADYSTIQDAINAAAGGETIIVAAGTYTESLSLNKQVNLTGSGISATTIEPSIVGGAVITIDGVTAPMTIQGFTIDALDYDDERGICIQNASGNITVEQNNIINFTENGILISSSNNNTIKNNTIISSSTGSNAGIYVDNQSGNNTIDGNTITLATSGSGNLYDIYFAGPNSQDNTVMNNIINGGKKAFQQDGGVSGTTTFLSNTIGNAQSPSAAGIYVDGGKIDMKGNIITLGDVNQGIFLNNNSGPNIIGGDISGEGNQITMSETGNLMLYAIHLGGADIARDCTIKENIIVGSKRAVQIDGPQANSGGTITIQNNIITQDNHEFGGIISNNRRNLVIQGNTITNSMRPIEFRDALDVTISGNTIDGTYYDAINAASYTGTVVVSDKNAFINILEGKMALNNRGTETINATCNWWGDDSGPSGEGFGSGAAVSTNVDYNPWLTQNSSLVYTGTPQPVNLVVLEATLSDSTNGISGMDVEFYLDGDPVGNATTGSDGVASLELDPYAYAYVVGVYEVYAKTACDLTSEIGYLVVYDPSEGLGFVTGGGWIDSPAGAYTDDTSLTGKATFGFVSKYKKGAAVPTGNTEFQFKAGDLNFHSDSYDWLVVAGDKAMYKGTGTINGTGDYGFMLSATDSDLDLFRIKIQDKINDDVIYDNKLDGEDGTELGGGQIIIHKGK